MNSGVTLCMIVKNEEKFIEGCLKSVTPIVDDIVIVDTGSTDHTLEIVKPFNPRIFHFKWCDDFSAARNAGIEHVKTPWILVLDADERIAACDHHFVLEAAQEMDYTGFELLWRNYGFHTIATGLCSDKRVYEEGKGYPGFTQDPMFRMFRNDPKLRYQGVVHEHVSWRTYPDKKVKVIDAVIHHYGRALGQERKAQKGELYLKLGYRKIEEFPDRWEPLYEIALQLQEFDRHDESIPYLEKAIKLAKQSEDRARMFLMIGAALKRRGDLDGAIAHYFEALRFGNGFSTQMALADAYAAQRNMEKAKTHYSFAKIAGPESALPAFNYGVFLRDVGDFANAEIQFKEAIRINPAFTSATMELANLQSGQNRLEEATDLLETVCERDPNCLPARQALAKAYVQLKRPGDALNAIGETGDDALSETLRGVARADLGEAEAARIIFERVLKKDRNYVAARINLANLFIRMGEPARAVRHLSVAYEQTNDLSILKMAQELMAKAS